MRRNMAFACFLLGGVIPLAFGIKDLLTTRFAPFQEVAAGMQWEQVPPGLQNLFGMMTPLSGVNLIGFSVALLVIIVVPFRRGEAWADWALLLILGVISLIAAYLLYDISTETGATLPWFGPLVALALFVAGFFLSTNRRADE